MARCSPGYLSTRHPLQQRDPRRKATPSSMTPDALHHGRCFATLAGVFSSLVPPKLVAPDAAHLCVRPRVEAAVAHGLTRPLTWLTAPAGAGKTCVAALIVARSHRAHLWLHLDADDAEPATFFHFMAQAARTAKPRVRLPAMLPEYHNNLARFGRRYFRELFGCLDEDTLIVLDNYELLPEVSPLHAVLAEAIDQTRGALRWIVASRAEPPPDYARLRACARLSLLSWQQLRLTREEAVAIARKHFEDESLDSSAVDAAYSVHQGWAAGLFLHLEADRMGDGLLHALPEDAGIEAMFDFFATVVLRELSESRRQFLLHTAFLPEMTADDARKLADSPDADEVLEQLSRRNQFTFRLNRRSRLGRQTTWYRYHPLFRRFLLSRAATELPRKKDARLRVEAGRILAARGQYEEAIELLRMEGHWDELSTLLRQRAEDLLEQGRHELLRLWLKDLPPHMGDATRGWLLYYLACARMPFDPVQAQAHYTAAFEHLVRVRDVEGLYLAWAGAAEAIMYGWGSFRDYDGWLAKLDEQLDQHASPSLSTEGRLAATVHGAFMFRRPNDPRINYWEQRVRKFLRLSRALNPNHYVMLAINIFHHDLWRGHIARARALLESLEGAIGSRRIGPLAILAFRTMQGVFGHFTGDGAASLRATETGLDFAQQQGIEVWNFLLLTQGAFGAIVLRDAETAKDYLTRMRALMQPERPLEQLLYADAAAQTALLSGNERDALAYSEQAVHFAVQLGALFPEAILRVGVSQTWFACGQPDRALDELELAQSMAQKASSSILSARCDLARAEYLLHLGERASAHEALRRGLAVCREQAYFGMPWWRADAMARLSAEALAEDIETPFVCTLIKRCGLRPPVISSRLHTWPFRVKVFVLTPAFALWVDGKELRFSTKAQRRPLELLQMLIALGGRGVGESRLAAGLWPDSDGDAAQQTLATTLHRLRKLIGPDAVERRDQQLSLNPSVVWVDALCCDHAWQHADATPSMLHEVLALYRAPLLASVESAWVLQPRERLRARYTRAVLRSADTRAHAGEPTAALDLLQRALDVEPGVEALYSAALRLLRQLSRDAEAADLYRRCQTQLRLHHGCDPSASTAQLAFRDPAS